MYPVGTTAFFGWKLTWYSAALAAAGRSAARAAARPAAAARRVAARRGAHGLTCVRATPPACCGAARRAVSGVRPPGEARCIVAPSYQRVRAVDRTAWPAMRVVLALPPAGDTASRSL